MTAGKSNLSEINGIVSFSRSEKRKDQNPAPLRPGKPVLLPLEEVDNRFDETALLSRQKRNRSFQRERFSGAINSEFIQILTFKKMFIEINKVKFFNGPGKSGI